MIVCVLKGYDDLYNYQNQIGKIEYRKILTRQPFTAAVSFKDQHSGFGLIVCSVTHQS